MIESQVNKDPARIAGMFDAIARRYDFLNHVLSAGLDRVWRRRAIRSLGIAGHETLLDVCTGTADVALAASAAGVRRAIGIDFAPEMLRIGQRKIRDAGRAGDARRARRACEGAERGPGAPASDRAGVRGGAPVYLVRADAGRIPCASESIDVATIAFGIRNVQDPSRALHEVARVLKPGGRLAILEFGVPRVPGLRRIYLWYFRAVLPRIGSLVSRHDSAYAYLPASVGAFPSAEVFADQLRAAGFSNVQADPLTLGIVYLYRAIKP